MNEAASLQDAEQTLKATRAKRYAAYPAYRPSDIDWLGDVPEHWEVKRLKHLCTLSALYGANIPSDEYAAEGVRFLRTSDIDDFGHLLGDNPVYVSPEGVRDYLLTDGDLLLSRSGTLGRSLVFDAKTHGSAAYAGYLVRYVLRQNMLPRFAFYFTKTKGFFDWLDEIAVASTIGNVNGRKFASMKLPCPPEDEQQAITRFLDEQTQEIDDLIAAKRKLLELLKEKRQALITHAVTKGLDPNAKLKPSGIHWFGDVPESWRIEQLRRAVDRFVDYRGRTPTKTDSGVPLITAGAVRDGEIDHARVPEYMAEEDYGDWMVRGWPEVGDILITTEAPLGEVALLRDTNVALAQRIILFKVNRRLMCPEYMRYFYLSGAGSSELDSRASGSTAAGIRADRLRASGIIVPPLSNQTSIVKHLDFECAALAQAIPPIDEAISKAEQLRTALVSAAVTGKIDVRGGAA